MIDPRKWFSCWQTGAHSASSKAEIDRHLELGRDLLARGQLADALTHYHAAVGTCRSIFNSFILQRKFILPNRWVFLVNSLHQFTHTIFLFILFFRSKFIYCLIVLWRAWVKIRFLFYLNKSMVFVLVFSWDRTSSSQNCFFLSIFRYLRSKDITRSLFLTLKLKANKTATRKPIQ